MKSMERYFVLVTKVTREQEMHGSFSYRGPAVRRADIESKKMDVEKVELVTYKLVELERETLHDDL